MSPLLKKKVAVLVAKPVTRARLHGKRVPLGDGGALPTRVEDAIAKYTCKVQTL